MSLNTNMIDQLVRSINAAGSKTTCVLVAIDGLGGSGKSTLAVHLADAIQAQIIQMDDFYLPSATRPQSSVTVGDFFDWERLKEQVLDPLGNGFPAKYQRYDWDSDRLEEWVDVSPQRPVIVEGVYCTRRELADAYDFTIWVDAPPGLRLRRGIERDGENARQAWVEVWMPQEDDYVRAHHPQERANVVVEGTSDVEDDGG
ncbi:MAG TPA: uridine kinase [Actinomycetota bacterium]|nr:uridine kinase [Actinomycetota bacterium]